MTIEIYSDIACPWCYVGERRLARALDAFTQGDRVDVVFRPYQLDPSLPGTPVPLREQLKEKFGPQLDATLRRTAATAAQEGIDLRFDEALAVNTLTAHRLLRLGEREGGPGAQRALAERLFEAYFTSGANVADPGVLADLAASVGMDRDEVRAYLASDEGVAEVQDEIAHARHLGIQAVPTFVFDGRYAVQGAQPTSAFLQVLEAVQRETAATDGTPARDDAPADACADGACAT